MTMAGLELSGVSDEEGEEAVPWEKNMAAEM